MKTNFKNFLHIGLASLTLVSTFAIAPILVSALPAGFETQVVASGFNLPTTIAFVPDGRIFVAEKGGAVKVVKNGSLLPTALITLTDVNSYGDRGLIGLAVDPNFNQNGYVYLSYSYENTPGFNYAGIKTARIVRITVVGDTADESSKVVLVGTTGGNINTPSCDNYSIGTDCIPSDAQSHSAGGLRFGPDGKLYASLGDGGRFDFADAKSLRAQNLDSLGGKMLRINTDGTAPSDNPFFNGNPNSNRSKIFAYGFRNMYRFNFRPGTNTLYGGDVGWNTWEEINVVRAGGNYGWPCREGLYPTGGFTCNAPGAIDPIYSYGHNAAGAAAVTGGTFGSGSAYPAQYANTYFFGDYAQDWIKTMTVSATDTPITISDFGNATDKTKGPVEFVTGPEGNIYFISIYTGELKKITHTLGNRQPITQIGANITSGLAPLSINFSSEGSVDPDGNPMTFTWNFGDTTSSTSANPSHTYTTNGVYTTTLTVSDTKGGQQTKSIQINVGNRAPTAFITSPATASLYSPGKNIQLVGNGTDPEDGTLPDSALSWRMILHHNSHIHVLQTAVGNNITFTPPDHHDPDVYTEIELTVKDSGGLTNTKSINIYLNNGSGTNNLIQNPGMENADPVNPAAPDFWTPDWYGVNDQIFTYPVPGYGSATSAAGKVQITKYTSGDAKWVFSPVSAQENTDYSFSDYYTSDVTTTLVAEIGFINGTHSYINLGDVPASATWKQATGIFTAPTGARTISILHVLDSVGSLTTDNFSLTIGNATTTPPGDTTPPIVSLTYPTTSGVTFSGSNTLTANATDNVAVAGVQFLVNNIPVGPEDTVAPYSTVLDTTTFPNGSYTIAARARDAAGNSATSTNVTVIISNSAQTGTNLITNGLFKTANGADPLGWNRGGWGPNDRLFTYPVPGRNGGKAIQVKMVAYTDGDAKWYPDDIPVTSGTQYLYSDWYMADDISDVIGQYTMTDGTFQYFGITKELVPTNVWKQASGIFTPPTGVKTVTFMHLISSPATLSISDVSLIVNNGTSTDTQHPAITILTPTASSTVSNSVTITSDAIDNIGVVGVQYYVDNNPLGTETIVSPYSSVWNTTTVPNGLHTIAGRARDAAWNTATSTVIVTVSNSTTTPDTIPPTVTVISPTASGTVSGSTNITANATDNVSVAGVQFFIDDTLFGTEDTVSPYSTNWNTVSFTNGAHTVKAVARDTSGNTSTSTVISVMVSNTVTPPAGNNLIANNSLETADPTNPTLPKNWKKGGYGTNTKTFYYPIAGQDGARGASITMTAYTDGDAKWIFDDVPVSTLTEYTFSEYYRSTVPTPVTIRYKKTDGTYYYKALPAAPAASTWTFRQNTFTVPTGMTSLTIYHNLTKVGTLDIDNYSLIGPGSISTTDTMPPTVSITSPADGITASSTLNIAVTGADNVALSSIKLSLDNVTIGVPATTSPANFSVDTKLYSNGSHTVSAVATDSSNNVATSTIQIIFNNQIPDTTPPTVTITSPTADTTVSATTTIQVSAIDNVGVKSVHFFIDTENLGTVTTAPYTASIDTTTLSNGSHTLYAHADDVAGNIGNATPVVINVSNTQTPPPAPNLIPNPSVETPDPADGTKPQDWFKGGWGTNDAVLSYPVAGIVGTKATRIQITSYTDGDAKWYFKDVAVSTTSDYTFKEQYRSNTTTTLTARFTYADNSVQYRDIATLPAVANWTTEQTSISIPTGAVSITLFHILAGVGFLETDDYYLGKGVTPTVNNFPQGLVSLTFDDGWLSQYQNAVPILNNAHLKGSFYIISQESIQAVPDNRISNGDLEVPNGSNPLLPVKWNTRKTGVNDAVFTYPATGVASSSGIAINVTSYTSGEAAWIPDDATVINQQDYMYTESYKSSTSGVLVARYTFNDNSVTYQDLATIPASVDWTVLNQKISPPTNLAKITIYHVLRNVGSLSIDNIDLDRIQVYINPTQIKDIWNAGHEIGAHTQTHVDLTAVQPNVATQEINGSRSDLLGLGLSPVDTFVYPYGAYNDQIKQKVQQDGFIAARSVDRGYNLKNTDKYALQIQQVDRTTTLTQFQSWVDLARNNKTWLILMFHQVDTTNTPLGVSPALLQQMVNFLTSQQVNVVTLKQGVAQMLP